MSVSEIEKSRLIELLKDIENHPEKTCPKFDSDSCSGCKFDDNGKCDMGARKADYLLEKGVIVPPCKVGDTVWSIYDNKVYEALAEQVTVVNHISGNKIIKIKAEFDVEDWFYNDGRKTRYGIYGYYQENVFLTKEEALSKLQESKGEEI